MKIINSTKAPAAIGTYSQATLKNGILFISGQLGINVETGNLEDTFEKQAELVFQHLGNILTEAKMSFANVVKVSVFVKDIGNFATFNTIYAKYFQQPYPARELIEVKDLPRHGDVEVSLIAME